MKKIVVAVAALVAFSFGASAQESKPAHPQQGTQHHDQKEKKDEIMMKDGKVYQKVDGKETVIESDLTLKNGTVITPDGTVKHADGSTVALKNGDYVNMEGKVWNKGEMHDQKVLKGEMNK